MIIVGCDYHPGFQQIALVDTDTGELLERRLQHPEEAEKFYRDLAAPRCGWCSGHPFASFESGDPLKAQPRFFSEADGSSARFGLGRLFVFGSLLLWIGNRGIGGNYFHDQMRNIVPFCGSACKRCFRQQSNAWSTVKFRMESGKGGCSC